MKIVGSVGSWTGRGGPSNGDFRIPRIGADICGSHRRRRVVRYSRNYARQIALAVGIHSRQGEPVLCVVNEDIYGMVANGIARAAQAGDLRSPD